MSDTPNAVSEALAGSEIVTKYFKPEVIKIQGDEHQPEAQVLAVPDGVGGMKIMGLKQFTDPYKVAPDSRTGTAQMLTLDSLIDHVNRFKDEDSLIFADNNRDNPSLNAVIDYHKKTFEGDPRNGDHRVSYKFPMSDEWKAWMALDGAKLDMQDFAEFIEDRISDVSVPPTEDELDEDDKLGMLMARIGGNLAGPQKLMELSTGLKVNVEEKVHQAITLASGETQLQFKHEHTDEQGAPIKVPNMFLITIPVFNSGDLFRIPVRLRYRARSGNISWTYQLYRTDQTFDAAFDDAIKKVGEETSIPVHIGKMET